MQKVLPRSGRSQECPSEKGFLEKSALEMGPGGFVSWVRGKELRQQDQNKEIHGKQKSTTFWERRGFSGLPGRQELERNKPAEMLGRGNSV